MHKGRMKTSSREISEAERRLYTLAGCMASFITWLRSNRCELSHLCWGVSRGRRCKTHASPVSCTVGSAYQMRVSQFSRSVVSDSLWPHGLQHTRPPCPSPTPGVYPNSCLLSRWCHPTILSSVVPFSSYSQSFPAPGSISSESTLRMRWPKYWSFSFSIIPCKEIPGLISFRMDWLDLLAVQGTLKSLLQHHSSKASILLHSAFFIVQLSYPYMTTGKTIALTRWTFVGNVSAF